jgi:hypothetical protein
MEQVGNFNKLAAGARAGLLRRRRAWAWRAPSRRSVLARAAGAPAGRVGRTQTQFQLPERLPDLPAERAKSARHRAHRAGPATGRAGRAKLGAEQTAQQPGPDAHDALRQRAGARAGAQHARTRRPRRRAGRSASSCRCSTGAAPGWPRRGDLHAGAAPRGGDRDQRPLGGARGLRRLPLGLRHRAPPARRDRAAASSGSPRNSCCATTACCIGVFELLADARSQIASVNGVDRGAARLLAGPGRSRHGARSAEPSLMAAPAPQRPQRRMAGGAGH